MELIVLALLFSFTKFCLICKFVGLRRALYFDKYIDLFFTIVVPMMFYGTFSGMVTMVFSGLFLSLQLFIAKLFFKPDPPSWFKRSKTSRS